MRKLDFKYEIKQRLINYNEDNSIKRDITIIDREIRKDKKGHNQKWYKYKCNKCGAELWIISGGVDSNNGCACCTGKVVVKGINDIATTNPKLVKYFVDIEDAYKHTKGTHKKVLCRCPNCNYEKEISVNNLCKHGFSCPKCSDGISYPEKVMYNLLKHLDIDFIYQLSKNTCNWVNKYKYDFYFKKDNNEYIVETHGLQHYEGQTGNWKMPLEEIQRNDKNKKELALNNGIKESAYIVIDCRHSNLEFIKNNILNSRLNEIFDLNNTDWTKIGQDSEKSLVKEVCDYWKLHNDINNENLSCTDISFIFSISRSGCREYLKQGEKLNLCNYNPKEEKEKSKNRRLKGRNNNSESIEVFKKGESQGIFDSASYLSEISLDKFGLKLSSDYIRRVCNGKRLTYKGYIFKYVQDVM